MELTWDIIHVLPFLCLLGLGFIHLAMGRARRGLFLVFAGFLCFDVALIWGLIFKHRDTWSLVALVVLHLLAYYELCLFSRQRFRRKSRRWQEARQELFSRGGQQYALGYVAQAGGHFKKIIRKDPWDVAPLVWLGFCFFHEERYGRAEKTFGRARVLDGKREWEFHIRLGLERSRNSRRKKKEVGRRIGGSRRGRTLSGRTLLQSAKKASA